MKRAGNDLEAVYTDAPIDWLLLKSLWLQSQVGTIDVDDLSSAYETVWE